MAYFLVSESFVKGENTQGYEEDAYDINHRKRNL